jgi:hypothetical protein
MSLNNFVDKLNNFVDKPIIKDGIYKPPKITYIVAWLIASFASNFISTTLTAFSQSYIYPGNFIIQNIIHLILGVVIFAGTWILVYNFFSLLNIKRVMPYLYFLVGCGFILRLILGVPIFYSILITLYALAPIYIFRAYFRKNPKRWY